MIVASLKYIGQGSRLEIQEGLLLQSRRVVNFFVKPVFVLYTFS